MSETPQIDIRLGLGSQVLDNLEALVISSSPPGRAAGIKFAVPDTISGAYAMQHGTGVHVSHMDGCFWPLVLQADFAWWFMVKVSV